MIKSTCLTPLLFSMALIACTPLDTKPVAKVVEGFPELPLKPRQQAPAAVTEALVPDFNDAVDALPSSGYQMPLNISVHEVSARDFFMGLVVDTKENMLVHPEVSGTISLELKNVTVEQTLDAVQKIYGYDYKKSDIGYMVFPATLQTKLFKVNRLDLIRAGKSNTRVSSGQVSSQSDNNNQGSNPNQNATQPNADDQQQTINESGSMLTTYSETDFWKELEEALQSILAVDKQATSNINRQSGVVVVRAKPMQIREVEAFLEATQSQISRQVILEAKILEVVLDDGHQAGVNWESIVREGINKAPLLTGLGAMSVAASSNVFSLGGTAGDFRAFVELLETQGKTNILSSPRISTLNNQKAIIKVGKDEYFITEVSTTTVAGGVGSAIVNPNVTFTPFFSGIALDVTPQIDDDENITLHIHPSITRVESQTKKFTINSLDGEVPMALNTVRESDSIVKAQNGQVIVLGGLMQETLNETKEGIAGLTQIPYLGNLFRVNTGKMQKSELIILLKSTIIATDNDWQNSITASKRHYRHLNALPRWQ